MNKKKKILAAIIAATMITSSMSGLCFAASAETATSAQVVLAADDGSVSITENFDDALESTDDIVWDVETTTTMGGISGGGTATLSNPAISLTTNAGKNILTMTNGAGNSQKDISVSFAAGVSYSFGQATSTWEMIFKSTAGDELFKIRMANGGWAVTSALVSGDSVQATNYTYVNSQFTDMSAYISFNANGGGTVTLGNVSADFAAGSNLGSISVTHDGVADQGRPFVIDNLSVNTVDKESVIFNVTSTEATASVAGAEVTIGNDTYTVDENGNINAYYLPGTYNYEVKVAKHAAKTGSFTVVDGENTVDIQLEYIGDPVPEKIELAGGEEYIYLPESGSISAKAFTATVYDNSGLVMEDAVVEWSLPGQSDAVSIADGVLTLSSEYPLTDDNGVDVTIRATVNYTDKDGAPQSVTEDTSIHIHNIARATSWTIAGPTVAKDGSPTTYSVTDVKDQYGNAFEKNCSFVLTSSDPNAVIDGMTITPNVGTARTEEVTLTVELAESTTTFNVGAGVSAATLIKAAYNEDGTLSGVETENVTLADGKYAFDGVAASNEKYMLWDSLTGMKPLGTPTVTTVTSGTKMDRTVTVYGYDFYEPGTGTASYGNPRMEVVNGVNSIVWPKSQGSNASITITLPEPVKLEAGTAKMITFDNIPIEKTVGSQERSLQFKNSAGVNIINIDFAGSGVVKDWSKVDGNYTGTHIGSLNELGVSSSALFVLKTNADGITSAVLSYNNSTLDEYVVSDQPLGEIASITMTGGAGAPDSRMLTLTNIIISDSDVAEVEIVGDDAIAKISGMTATKKFKGSIFSQADGETFEWTVADSEGNAIEGVTIDQEGVLSVTDAVAADTVAVISYTSSLSTEASPKLATHEVTIKDFAAVASFDVVGPVAVNAGESVTYSVKNVVDEYGDEVNMPVNYVITAGEDVATVDAATGVVTTTGKLGKYTVEVTVGNPGKTMAKTIEAEVAKYSEVGETTDASVTVDVTLLANYAADTKYLVTTATADGVKVDQKEVAHTDGKVTVDMTGAAKYEVSPIYSYTGLGNISGGHTIPLGDGLYDFTFKKAEGTRGDIFVNGAMVGNNVDQYGKGKATSGSYYTVKDVVVQGGSAVVSMHSNATNMESIVAKKAPSILPRKTHVYVLGDSLVSSYYGTFADADGDGVPTAGDAQTGWGQVIDQFISDDLNVTNLAESGNYAVGLQGAPFGGVLANAKAGDYLIMECGYNDANYSSESAMATALEEIAADCKKAGITLILSTPNFGTARGDTNKADVKFGPKILAVAQEQGVLGVNLSGMGYADFTASGKTADYWTQNFNVYYDGAVQDNLHLSYHGAMKNAYYVMQAIYNAQQDTTNPELAAELANLKVDTTAINLIDSEGATMTLQVKAAE